MWFFFFFTNTYVRQSPSITFHSAQLYSLFWFFLLFCPILFIPSVVFSVRPYRNTTIIFSNVLSSISRPNLSMKGLISTNFPSKFFFFFLLYLFFKSNYHNSLLNGSTTSKPSTRVLFMNLLILSFFSLFLLLLLLLLIHLIVKVYLV